jgi:hypothetical protein
MKTNRAAAMKGNKAAAWLLCLLLCLALLSSALLIAAAAGHDCAGDSCHICLELRASFSLLGSMALTLLAAGGLPAPAGSGLRFLKTPPAVCQAPTLVSLKVKLTI